MTISRLGPPHHPLVAAGGEVTLITVTPAAPGHRRVLRQAAWAFRHLNAQSLTVPLRAAGGRASLEIQKPETEKEGAGSFAGNRHNRDTFRWREATLS